MKRILLHSTVLLLAIGAYSQGSDRLYGVTGAQPGDINWTSVRQLSGYGKENTLLLDSRQPANFINVRTARKSTPTVSTGAPDPVPAMAGIAALAYDEQNHRLYFAPMFREGGLRYIDLKQSSAQKAVHVFDDSYNLLDRQRDGEGKNITRMVIGKGGVGYAISNDGMSFIRFGTGRDAKMENLGTLIDDVSNASLSVHNQCSSWGGDLVAAYTGELYLFTMRQQVFKIDPETRIATHVGTLKNADPNFSVNGAAVDSKGQVILTSAVIAGKRLVIEDMTTLETKTIESKDFLNATDLASSNLLFTPMATKTEMPARPAETKSIGLYPNPVTTGTLTLVFESVPTGRYQIDMLNAAGSVSQTQRVDIQQKGQTTRVNTNRLAKGFYFVRITNAGRQEVFAEKVLIQ